MKKTIIICLAALLLLAGCGTPAETTEPSAAPTVPTTAPPPQGCYVPGSDAEELTNGAVRLYLPGASAPEGLAAMGDKLLLFAGTGAGTRLTVLAGEDCYPVAVLDAGIHIDPFAPSTQVTDAGLSYFDSLRQETVLLDETLREILRLSAPADLVGDPLVSRDRLTLYYIAGSSICALDLETGIPRTVRQFSGEVGTLQGLILEDSILICDTNGTTQFLDTQTGQLLDSREGAFTIATAGMHYQASLFADGLNALVFGTGEESPKMLNTPGQNIRFFLPHSGSILELTGADPLSLNHYDLSQGLLTATVTIPGESITAVVDDCRGNLWILVGDRLYRWNTHASPSGDSTCYTGPYFTRSNPDLAGIARCQTLAQEISLRHGVEVLVWEDAIAVQPWDYHLTEEYLVPILEEQLRLLDERLSRFPEGFLATLSESFQGLSVCLVRQLRGDLDYGTLDNASGLQFWVEDRAYIALSTIHSTEGSLYHELCHVIDTRVFTHSNAYDQWEALNPSGFAYDYDYAANATRNAGEYLRDAERCFIDTYSMSFPKEDRARILEYAMTEGNAHYFQSRTMQNKLRQLCIGLRDAFGLKKSPETFAWEQYLQESLAYTK